MKGYGLLFLVAAAILLLLPLPAFSKGTASTPPSSPADTASDITDSSEPLTQTAVFRVLCGEEVVALTERDFLLRTLALEMSPTVHTEALKAQTVAAYTYYSRRRAIQNEKPDASLKGADFVTPADSFPTDYTDEALKQRWGDKYDAYRQKLEGAVDSVTGYTLQRDGALIDACYFAISNGSTESAATVWGADIPYLQAVASPGDRLAPDYCSTLTLTPTQVQTALAAEAAVTLPDDPAAWFGKPTLSAAGTVDTIPVGGTTLKGTQVRQLLGLRSATFTVDYDKERFTFTVYGYGHGVGMSQYGADYLARQGYTYEEILQYYYQGVTLAK
ncbi:MAG: stage II sporulation protein D [Clostridia bacterium]|nr:stage II sporulation protein D [Clostridia bacterium]